MCSNRSRAQVGQHALADPGRSGSSGPLDAAQPSSATTTNAATQSMQRARVARHDAASIASLATQRPAEPVARAEPAARSTDRIALPRVGPRERDRRPQPVERAPPARTSLPSGRARRWAPVAALTRPPSRSGASSSSGTNVRSTRPCAPDLGVDGARVDELSWRPRAATRPSSSTTISSASAIVESRWAMMIVVRPSITVAQRQLDPRLGGGVDRRRGVVEDQDARVDQQRARDRDALALTARERQPALADDRVVAVGQRLDELVRLRLARRASTTSSRRRVRARRRRCCSATVVENRNVSSADDRDRAAQVGEPAGRARRRRRAAPGPAAGRRSAGSSEASVVLPEPVRPISGDRAAGARSSRSRSRSTGRPAS